MHKPSKFAPALAATAIALAAAAVHATPDPQADVLQQWLQDQGLLRQAQRARDAASELVLVAMNFLDVPYRNGGNSAEQGFDCSGFTRHIFQASLGLVLPRRAAQQAEAPALKDVQRDDLQAGDLVFFNTLKHAFSHVGIYLGNGKFIHAPRSGAEVRVDDMRQAYWRQRFDGARRAELETPAATLR